MGYERAHYFSVRHSYKIYRKTGEIKPLALKPEFMEIATGFMKFIVQKVQEGEQVRFPERMGTLELKGRKLKAKVDHNGNINNLPVDWNATRKLRAENEEARLAKKVVHFENAHTNGLTYFITWSKKNVLIRSKDVYSFKIAKHPRIETAKKIKEGGEYLIERKRFYYKEPEDPQFKLDCEL